MSGAYIDELDHLVSQLQLQDDAENSQEKIESDLGAVFVSKMIVEIADVEMPALEQILLRLSHSKMSHYAEGEYLKFVGRPLESSLRQMQLVSLVQHKVNHEAALKDSSPQQLEEMKQMKQEMKATFFG